MKRTILSLTTAIALAAPAFAQDNFDSVIADALQRYGYAEENIDTLTEGERTEIYTAATSGDAMDVRTALAGMDLTEMGMSGEMANVEVTPDTELEVEEVLTENGYPEGTIDLLTQAEIANIYVAATSGDESEVQTVLSGLELSQADGTDAQAGGAETTAVTPDSTQEVIAYLEERGYSQEEISGLSDGDFASIYVAITSDDENEINQAIESAMN